MFYKIKTVLMNIKKIALFASGSGTNALNIMRFFSINTYVEIDSLFTNNPNAGVVAHAQAFNVPIVTFSKDDLYKQHKVLNELKDRHIDLIVLAGFLWLLPQNIVSCFKVINIHPALLPRYGGKGMYGLKVHEAVIQNHEKESGITIHMVDEVYDSGAVLLQKSIAVLPTDTPESLQQRIHELEYQYYPEVIAQLLME